MNVRHLFGVLPSLCFSVTNFFKPSLVKAIEQVDEGGDEQTENCVRETLVKNCGIKQHCRSGAGELCCQCPDKCLRCRHKGDLPGFEAYAPRSGNRAQCVLQRCEYEQRNQKNV